MRISVIQMESTKDVKRNLSHSLEMLSESLKFDPELVIFPEYQMLVPDYHDTEGTRKKFEQESGEFVSSFLDYSSSAGIGLMINFAELSLGYRFNTSLLVVDGKIRMKYRKTHLFDAYVFKESDIYAQGDLLPDPVNFKGMAIAPMICYDIRFAELARIYENKGADILTYQAGWYEGENKLDLWLALLRTRSTECGCYSIGAAQCGSGFSGHSSAFSPYGNSLGELNNSNGILNLSLDHSLLEKYRNDVPLGKQRRSDLYRVTY